jgi:hypothetical protein
LSVKYSTIIKPINSGSLSHGPAAWICGFAVLCSSASIAADAEPSHNGRLLSEWLADVHASSGVDVVGAPNPPEEAIRAIGTNAIPTLLKWISYEPSPSERSSETGAEVPRWRRHTLSTKELADSTQSVFGILGVLARPAIPELTRLARTSSDPERAERCAVSLAAIGPEAIPSLVALATNGPASTRRAGAFGLEYFSRKPEGVRTLPALIACLADTNTAVSGSAQRSLIFMDPAVAVPALTIASQSASARTRLRAIQCLEAFEYESPTNVPPITVTALRAESRDPEYEVRDAATRILRRMGGWELVGERWVSRHGTNILYGITPDFFTDAPGANPQGRANGRQPFSSETNQTSEAAASRRSP